MKTQMLLLVVPAFFCSCAGDLAVTRSSTPQPTRTAAISGRAEVRGAPQRPDRYAPDQVYLVTRPGTADQSRGEWRAQGNTIREWGSRIQFIELSSGQSIEFTAPHQVTPTPSTTDLPIVNDRAFTPPPVVAENRANPMF